METHPVVLRSGLTATLLQPADPLKQAGVHRGRYGLAIPPDHAAVVLVLHLIEHRAQVLVEAHGTGFSK